MSSKTLLRLVAASAATALLGGTLAACSTGSPAGSSDTLTIATSHEPAVQAAVDAFKKENPDADIEVKVYAQDYRGVVGAQLAGGNAPDILEISGGGGNPISAKVGGERGFYADLSDRDWAADVPDSSRDQLSLDDGKLMAVPTVISSIAGIYNQGAIDELGLSIPTTWDEVLQFCADASDAGHVAYGLGLADTWTTSMYPYALTASLVYSDPNFVDDQIAGKTTFSDSGWKQAYQQMVDMRDAGCFNKSPNGTPYAQVQDAIRSGETLGTVNVSSEVNTIATGGASDLELTYAPFPATDDPAETYLSTSGDGLALNAKSADSELALQFLDFMATPEGQIAFAEGFGDAAAMPGDQQQDDQVSALVQKNVEAGTVSTWPDRLWTSTTIQPEVTDGVQGLMNDSITVDELLSKMDAAFNAG
ncbi:ABC transporter substrate-binding protein [Promicromonospora sp. Marseille-Q5078]